jgi:hypothetical protein
MKEDTAYRRLAHKLSVKELKSQRKLDILLQKKLEALKKKGVKFTQFVETS